jgi:hypothetical protein
LNFTPDTVFASGTGRATTFFNQQRPVGPWMPGRTYVHDALASGAPHRRLGQQPQDAFPCARDGMQIAPGRQGEGSGVETLGLVIEQSQAGPEELGDVNRRKPRADPVGGWSNCARRPASVRSMSGPHEAFCRLMVGTAIQPIREAQRSCLSVDAVASPGSSASEVRDRAERGPQWRSSAPGWPPQRS